MDSISCQIITNFNSRGRKKMKKTFAIMVRVDQKIKLATEEAAMDDHRSVASLVQKLLVVYLKDSGYLEGIRHFAANKFENEDPISSGNGENRKPSEYTDPDTAGDQMVDGTAQRLTTKEHEVLDLILAGNSDHEIADYLDTHVEAVEGSRAKILEMVTANSFPHLIRTIVRQEIEDQNTPGADL